MQRAAKRSAVAAAGVAVALVGFGCGGTTNTDRTRQSAAERHQQLTAEDRLVEGKLVTDGELRRTRPDSVKRAFLEYWSALGHEEWSVAVTYLSPEVRRVLQAPYVPATLRIEDTNSSPIKPMIRGVHIVRGRTTIRYLVRTSAGRLRPTSVAWVRRKGVWYIAYSPTLDESYGAAVQQAVQSDIDPTATKASKRALTAGVQAARAQAATLAPRKAQNAAARSKGG